MTKATSTYSRINCTSRQRKTICMKKTYFVSKFLMIKVRLKRERFWVPIDPLKKKKKMALHKYTNLMNNG